jgi:ketosteroid isomerase-like protein
MQRWQKLFDAYQDPIEYDVLDRSITVGGDVAFSHSLNRISGTANSRKAERWLRWTTCYRKINSKWLIVHEHFSVPIDSKSDRALLNLEP